jgi:hypothetical protein
MTKFPPLRPQAEIQRVHDILMQVLGSERLRAALPPKLVGPFLMTADCLCWVLGHDDVDHAEAFADTLADLEMLMAAMGQKWQVPEGAGYPILTCEDEDG